MSDIDTICARLRHEIAKCYDRASAELVRHPLPVTPKVIRDRFLQAAAESAPLRTQLLEMEALRPNITIIIPKAEYERLTLDEVQTR